MTDGSARAGTLRTSEVPLSEGTSEPAPEVSALPPHVPAATVVGSLLLPAGDEVMTKWITEHGVWEAAESAALMTLMRPGAHVIDVGAHVGYMTLLAGARVSTAGSVLAIEANPGNFALLRANVQRNALTNVRLVQRAAWRRSGEELTMTISPDNSGDHRVFLRDGGAHTVDVRSVAVDDLIPDDWRVDLVKVDVQGTDHVAIEGMRRTIERFRPTLLVEFWPEGIEEFGDQPEAVLAFYRDLDYDLAMLEEPTLLRDAPLQRIVDAARQCPGAFCTLLLQPHDMLERRRVGEAAESLLARGPIPGARSVLGPFGPAARKVVLRLIKPYTSHQRVVDAELVRDLRELGSRIDDLEEHSL